MSLPLIGAALDIKDLEVYRNWILDHQRDVELQDFHHPDMLTGDWEDLAARAKTLLAGHTGRLGLHGPFRGFLLHSQDPDIRRIIAKRLDQILDVCMVTGATQVVIHSPFTAWDHHNFLNFLGSFDNVVEDTHKNIGAAVKRAANQGVTLVLENVDDVDPNSRKTLAESFASDAIRVSVDTGHAAYAHGSNGAPPVDYFIRSAGALLDHVHLQDADGYADRHWSIGAGSLPWGAVFKAIADLPTQPRLLLELRNKADIPASMAFLTNAGLAA
ncbi:sugar phosphate isomerase/epimerase [Actibacterium sp. 188UL27-1]|uniref:sugar phosphate isomerase/epimerase family protein n=1 Tax=Actibacterium sp. 188UL27-1 TaxID=2786961 RepID=UPI00195B06D1|nr:TIM barrel protein [Actibacterium sp. 188UL27-1]MBM7067405.1 sugar phosphate isomerase/epimerase [Actibacterium sp. 188UL27-1]